MNRQSVGWQGGPYRGVLVVLLALVVVTAGPVALASAGAGTGDRTTVATVNETTTNASAENTTADNSSTNATAENVSFGAEVSAFMASSAAATNGTVDQGMWSARFDDRNASERALVASRADTLHHRLAELRERRQALLAAHANGTIPDIVFRARLAALDARFEQLVESTNDTARAARRAGVTPPGLSTLRDALNGTVPGAPAGGNPPTDPGKGPADGSDSGPTDDPGSGSGNAAGNGSGGTASGGADGTTTGGTSDAGRDDSPNGTTPTPP